ncbi:reductive dehalogenase [Dehalobacter sp. 14DCB1]|uniref:reductive dehalogenase n=1 Tax=Dehalobacter sp. 14DCB1 TaxID=2070227 RepID=UPI001049FA8A|nr:reductive dehalogenase [Dehalobacter sp. 14DCB1]TCX53505.1 reductive dehalogenase [Dehalobacter sp. 14DCB1]
MDLGNEKTESTKQESTKQEKAFSQKFSRRGFLKTSVGIGAGAAGAALLGYDGGIANAAEVVQHDTMPVEISSDYQRYDQKKGVIFRAMMGDPAVKTSFETYFGKHMQTIPINTGEGYGRLEEAMVAGAWGVEDGLNGYHAPGFSSQGLYEWKPSQVSGKVNPNQYKFESPEAASEAVKRAAKFFGASLVGITPYDERWVFSKVFDMQKLDSVPNVFPFQPTNAIVLALEMDYQAFEAAPTSLELAATGNIYSNMGVLVNKLSHFIRSLGYQTIPCGNDTALSVPMAIQAGLGELSRIGILITPEFGPRQRLCKIFTDLPLAVDKPITFGVKEFCMNCKKCADACPSQAISHDKEPSFVAATPSTNAGVKRWALNADKCLKQWGEAGTDCGVCIKVCPYNKPNEWHHDFVKLGTRTPARPVLRFFDDLFGYGKATVTEAIKEFWKK